MFRKILITAVAIISIIILNPAVVVRASEVTPEATYLISVYNTSLKIAPNDTFVIEGRTQTYTVVEKVSVTVYLQVWNGTQWKDIKSWSSVKDNDNLAYINVNIGGMPKGHYYRTRSVHSAKLNNYTETLSSYSGSCFY